MEIRRAGISNIDAILNLLSQVLEVHAELRPDLFISGKTKYTASELEEIIKDDRRPVYVALVDGEVAGYAFCIINDEAPTNCTHARRELYIDDICVDETMRGQHIATSIFEYIKLKAVNLDCDMLTLNVWTGNTPAQTFYESMGMTPRKTMMEYKL